jgi:hypothetical protein
MVDDGPKDNATRRVYTNYTVKSTKLGGMGFSISDLIRFLFRFVDKETGVLID